jgi:hypothetical protein
MSTRRIPYMSKRAFRPALEDLEGRRLLSSVSRSAAPQGTDGPSTPAIAVFNNTIYLAWVSVAHKMEIASSSNGGTTFGNQITLPVSPDTTSPAMTVFDGRLYIAWKGTDKGQHLNVESSSNGVNFDNKVTLPDSSDFGPALASFDGRLYIAWKGTDKGQHLNVESSSNGVNFGNKVALPDTTSAGPALADANGQLYIAWVGIDTGRHLNVESSSNGVNFGNKVALPETSEGNAGPIFEHPSPALAGFDGSVYIAWKGRDGHLSTESSTDGLNFGGKVTYSMPVDLGLGAALASSDGSLYLGWVQGGGKITDMHVKRIAPATDALTGEDAIRPLGRVGSKNQWRGGIDEGPICVKRRHFRSTPANTASPSARARPCSIAIRRPGSADTIEHGERTFRAGFRRCHGHHSVHLGSRYNR